MVGYALRATNWRVSRRLTAAATAGRCACAQRLTHALAGVQNESCAAFVTARTRLTQSVSTTGLISFDTNYWTAEPAPQPDDVIWDNVPYRGFERSVRKWFAWAIFIGLVLLFIPIVAFLQQIINLDSYAKYSPNNWAGAILDLPVVGGAAPFCSVVADTFVSSCRRTEQATEMLPACGARLRARSLLLPLSH